MLRYYSVFIFEKSLIMKSSAVPVLVTIQFQDYPPPPKKIYLYADKCSADNSRRSGSDQGNLVYHVAWFIYVNKLNKNDKQLE